MFSMPPAMATSNSPVRRSLAASMTLFIPEPHTLFTVTAPQAFGSPA